MKAKYEGQFMGCPLYSMGECKILVSGPIERSEIGWHFSISCADRNPTWEEQKSARYQLIPNDVYMAQILPPKEEYVNLHKFCFHWHEVERGDFVNKNIEMMK